MKRFSCRKNKGQSMVELAVGLIFLVPIALFLLDGAVVVCANMANDNLAKTCCRAAASAVDTTVTPNVGTAKVANNAALAVASKFAASAMINPSGNSFLTGFGYMPPITKPGVVPAMTTDTTPIYPGTLPAQATAPAPLDNSHVDASGTSTGQVGCVTTMVVSLPVPFPFLPATFSFASMDVEPIVSPQTGQ